ncbi:MAG: hypothetical protein JWO50_761 [Candidatus Kaiserbacteria bacterium]|nr:hypothetical protein [Candidatus Kaiserbacteria bacterium]
MQSQSEDSNLELLKQVKKLKIELNEITRKLNGIETVIEFPTIRSNLLTMFDESELKDISVAFLQRQYSMGYARARLIKDRLINSD